jgi:hypothetical protein
MRRWILFPGIAAVAIGLVLVFVPVVAQPTEIVPADRGAPTYYRADVTGFSITGVLPILITWTASTTVTLVAGACTSACTNFTDISDLTLQEGTGGHFTLDQPVDGSIFVGANASGSVNGSVTIHPETTISAAGSILLVGGIIAVLVGLFLRPRPGSPAPSPDDGTPAAESTDDTAAVW